MSSFSIRKATLDDAQAISRLFRERIDVWQRIDPAGKVENVPYEALTIYERWLHGGAWMSVETGAIHLNHLIGGGGIGVVVEEDEFLLGYAEAYPGNEPPPFGRHVHITDIAAHFEQEAEVKDALIRHIIEAAKKKKTERVTVSFSGYDTQSASYYQQYGMKPLSHSIRYTLPAKTGQGFYKVVDHPNADANQVDGWYMTVGRLQSARQHWETLWNPLWQAVEEIAAQKKFRLHFNAAGHEALICVQQQLYDERSVDVYCWSPKPLTTQLLTALRDWVHRQNYRVLILDIPEDTAKILGAEAESSPYTQDVYAVNVL